MFSIVTRSLHLNWFHGYYRVSIISGTLQYRKTDENAVCTYINRMPYTKEDKIMVTDIRIWNNTMEESDTLKQIKSSIWNICNHNFILCVWLL